MPRALVALLVAAVASAGAPADVRAAGAATPSDYRQCARYAARGVSVPTCAVQLGKARAATRKYLDVTAALADGFVPTTQCETTAAGAMGMHWARADRMAVDGVDPATPEILLYIPSGTGFRLVGAEYEQSALVDGVPWWAPLIPPGTTISSAPRMFGGKVFDGPMPGHVAVQPWHYDLHVNLWATNPSGVFAQYNPAISCS